MKTKSASAQSAASAAAAKASAGKKVQFLHKPNCTTCRKARNFLEKRGFQLYFRDLAKERLSPAELEKLIGKRDHTDFLNTRNELYRNENMKENPPSRKEADPDDGAGAESDSPAGGRWRRAASCWDSTKRELAPALKSWRTPISRLARFRLSSEVAFWWA